MDAPGPLRPQGSCRLLAVLAATLLTPFLGSDVPAQEPGELPGYYQFFARAGRLQRLAAEQRRDELVAAGDLLPVRLDVALPDLALPDARGEVLHLRALVGDAPLVVVPFRAWWCRYGLRQLGELYASRADFRELGAHVVAIAQLERDPALLLPIERFFGPGLIVMADPDQVSARTFALFDVYIADREGRLRRRIPGEKDAPPRLDVILRELRELAGGAPVPAPDPSAGAPVEAIVDVRWLLSHDVVRPGDAFKLALLPQVADGYHVYGAGAQGNVPFSLELELPPGLLQTSPVRYPAPQVERDPVLGVELPIHHGDIPMSAFELAVSETARPGLYDITARLGFQASDGITCLLPIVREVRLPLRVADRETDRQPLYGWETW